MSSGDLLGGTIESCVSVAYIAVLSCLQPLTSIIKSLLDL